MVKYFLAVLLVLFISKQAVIAQQLSPSKGSLEVVQDEKIEQLTDQYRTMSRANPDVDGYRIQIYFDSGSNSKNKASTIKGEFELAYPGVKAYLSYKEPYYRVRVGNFRTIIEAVGFQNKITIDYPNSFPVKDKIVQ